LSSVTNVLTPAAGESHRWQGATSAIQYRRWDSCARQGSTPISRHPTPLDYWYEQQRSGGRPPGVKSSSAAMPIFTALPGPLKLELVEARPFAGGNVGHVYMPRTS
jgi:hypothetical protein